VYTLPILVASPEGSRKDARMADDEPTTDEPTADEPTASAAAAAAAGEAAAAAAGEAAAPAAGEAAAPAAGAAGAPAGKSWWQYGRRWLDFGAAVLLVGLFPLIPLVFEFGIQHEITSDAIMITAALYGLAVAVTSRNVLSFALFLCFTIAAAGFYGHSVPVGSNPGQAFGTVWGMRLSATSEANVSLGIVFCWGLILPFLAVVGQRALLHMRLGQRFLLFV
jgi:hypothetical protein